MSPLLVVLQLLHSRFDTRAGWHSAPCRPSTGGALPATFHPAGNLGLGGSAAAKREQLATGVFRPSYTLPTMSVEQFGELEYRRWVGGVEWVGGFSCTCPAAEWC